ncbi:MAG: AAA family ATPase, partial [Bacteroidaceae bacterium]|nr:AAA family ATPase [Bacteroidaceae bacterium]
MIKTYFERKIKEKFGYEPTFQQEKALNIWSDYLFSGSAAQICVIKGYAGTGKTSLVSALVKVLTETKQKVMLLAPTGRAAKVFSKYAGHPAYTIHRRIYREKSVAGLEGEFALNYNKYPNTLFIVDEASMIANSGLSGGMFGTGRLLDDLISFVFQSDGCKLILLGD